jgi:sRNA-binding protein
MTDAPAATPPSAAETKRERAAQARALLGRLAERYPACFTRDAAKVRPLAIGMQQKLRAELVAAPEAGRAAPQRRGNPAA